MLDSKESKLEDIFLNDFKNKVNKYLIGLQNSGDETWSQEKFLFYTEHYNIERGIYY